MGFLVDDLHILGTGHSAYLRSWPSADWRLWINWDQKRTRNWGSIEVPRSVYPLLIFLYLRAPIGAKLSGTTRRGRRTSMNPNKMLWEKGDFTRIAECMRESGIALVGTLGVTQGLKVLDLGCGDGTTAIPAAMLGADVLGVDIASNLVAAGSRRARQMGLTNIRFEAGDASNLVGIGGCQFRPCRQHFRCDVCPQTLRCGEGNGPGHAPRRTDRHGELDCQ